ncbi:low molecular weight phosphatase family protein [Olleya aquimaris]|uniref:Arsenate reductase n=1 Tax=Olleya aquimaris TaxID=639310 RepID=A0A327RMG1_9FLAO|nr:protein-tyrosine-phosphatase [Olleya aquimaris]RAJ17082.1 arsenate reductase [Olleya aquimaris]
MFQNIKDYIDTLKIDTISKERQAILQPLIDFITTKSNNNQPINLNLICTHNSRRSHLSQVWAQVIAHYYSVKNVTTYSGGTEATAMFPKVGETLIKTGFKITALSEGKNPVYSIKYSDNLHPIIAFSKTFDNDFNPKSEFAAIMTCSSADQGCPFIAGAEQRIPVTYEDPKAFDNTELQDEKYLERSTQIATEMKYVFQQVITK